MLYYNNWQKWLWSRFDEQVWAYYCYKMWPIAHTIRISSDVRPACYDYPNVQWWITPRQMSSRLAEIRVILFVKCPRSRTTVNLFRKIAQDRVNEASTFLPGNYNFGINGCNITQLCKKIAFRVMNGHRPTPGISENAEVVCYVLCSFYGAEKGLELPRSNPVKWRALCYNRDSIFDYPGWQIMGWCLSR